MARKPRIHAPGALYHVMLRGNGGDDLFFSDRDRRRLEALVAEGVERFKHLIHAYCWMTNHVHLAIQVGDVPLSKIIQNLAFRHARRINKRRGRMGHLFQGRYRALLVDRDRYLLALVRYIHLNPVKAGLVTRPEAYRWSSHRAYLGLAAVPWLSTGPVLRCFAKRQGESRRRFKAFVNEEMTEGGGEAGSEGMDPGKLFPGEEFPAELCKGAEHAALAGPSIDEICALVCRTLGLSERELSGASRARRMARARHVIAFFSLERGGGTLTELGARFGRDPSALHRGVARLRGEIERDAALRRMIACWSEALSKSQ